MTEFVQIHLLTAYPAANLNRDDIGRPKSVIVGGQPRLRISSQALKRAWRGSSVFADRLGEHLGSRTMRLGEHILERLRKGGMADDKALETTRNIAELFGKPQKGDGNHPARIEQLAFISQEEWARAEVLADKALAGETLDTKPGEILGREDSAVDIAMFGRMLASNPAFNREAAVQVAHAFTTHKAIVEDDYYSAIDDLNDPTSDADSNAGAAFIGVQGFGSGLFYLYACIDTNLLKKNLGGNVGLARDGVAALVEAAATTSPKGKQASFASRAHASYILVERGDAQPRNLFAAFLKPVHGEDVLDKSIRMLEEFRIRVDGCYDVQSEVKSMNTATGEGTLADVVRHACAFGD